MGELNAHANHAEVLEYANTENKKRLVVLVAGRAFANTANKNPHVNPAEVPQFANTAKSKISVLIAAVLAFANTANKNTNAFHVGGRLLASMEISNTNVNCAEA
jgi:hypothetical protein